jgi:hypothetical protein
MDTQSRARIEILSSLNSRALAFAQGAATIALGSLPFVMTGTTPGLGVGETVELTPFLELEDGKAYSIEVNAIMAGVDSVAGDVVQRIIRNKAVARKFGGTTTLASAGLAASSGDAEGYLLTFVVAAAPDRIQMVFSTNAKTALVNVLAEVGITELPFLT